MEQLIELLTNYFPEVMTASIGGISIIAVVYLVGFIFTKLKEFRTDPEVAKLKEENKNLQSLLKESIEQNNKNAEKLNTIYNDLHHIYTEDK